MHARLRALRPCHQRACRDQVPERSGKSPDWIAGHDLGPLTRKLQAYWKFFTIARPRKLLLRGLSRADQIREYPERPRHTRRQLPEPGERCINVYALSVARVEQRPP